LWQPFKNVANGVQTYRNNKKMTPIEKNHELIVDASTVFNDIKQTSDQEQAAA
jgi:hypothetical protein